MSRAVVCLASSVDEAERVIHELLQAGFATRDMSALLPQHRAQTIPARSANEGNGGGSGLGFMTALDGVGTLAILGCGTFLAAGPIMAVLAGPSPSAGLSGAMIHMGIPELEAKLYEGKLREGSILIAIHSIDIEERVVARRIFERAGGEHISYTTEESV